MTIARTWGVALRGIDGALVEVEADLSAHVPAFIIIGLPDKALGEAQQRVRGACANCAIPLPDRRITVNLSPASLPKHGSGFDVAIAIAALATRGGIDLDSVADTVHLGELGLDGRVRPVPGVLPAVLAAVRAGKRRVVVPHANRAEAELVHGAEVFAVTSLADVAALHGAEVMALELDAVAFDAPPATAGAAPELADVVGQSDAVESLIAAAAGGHNVLMQGPPGAGKTMLAERLPGILPPLDDDAALEVAALRSLAGRPVTALETTPPFESPHHSASMAALVGGGSRVIGPGAIARASNGVLFLDEAAEFSAHSLDALRQPLEKGRITIHRAGGQAEFPARFQLVLATNPCPCGNFGAADGICTCSPNTVRRYFGKLSGPLLDRVDIRLTVHRVRRADALTGRRVRTAEARERVIAARERAAVRWGAHGATLNREVPGALLRHPQFMPMADARTPLDRALERGALTLRGYDRALRVAWSLADLAGRARPEASDIGRALFLRQGVGA